MVHKVIQQGRVGETDIKWSSRPEGVKSSWNVLVWQEILQKLTSEHKGLHQEVKKKKAVLRKIERELQQSEEVWAAFSLKTFQFLTVLISGSTLLCCNVCVPPGTVEGRKSEPTFAPSDGKLRGPGGQRVPRGQEQQQEAAEGHSHLGEEGQDRAGKAHLIRTNQGPVAPRFHFLPPLLEVLSPNTQKPLCLAQMTSKSSATAAALVPSAEGGAGSVERQIPVKLPPLPEHRWKGRKREPLVVAVWKDTEPFVLLLTSVAENTSDSTNYFLY